MPWQRAMFFRLLVSLLAESGLQTRWAQVGRLVI